MQSLFATVLYVCLAGPKGDLATCTLLRRPLQSSGSGGLVLEVAKYVRLARVSSRCTCVVPRPMGEGGAVGGNKRFVPFQSFAAIARGAVGPRCIEVRCSALATLLPFYTPCLVAVYADMT